MRGNQYEGYTVYAFDLIFIQNQTIARRSSKSSKANHETSTDSQPLLQRGREQELKNGSL